MAIEKNEVVEAVFDADVIKTFSSLAKAEEQKPLYIIVASNENHYNDNWLRKWEIRNLHNPGQGFIKGLWKSSADFRTNRSWFPNDPHGSIADPKGEVREFKCIGNDVPKQILERLNQLFSYESWAQFELATKNKSLERTVVRLQAENLSLSTKLAEAIAKLSKLNQ